MFFTVSDSVSDIHLELKYQSSLSGITAISSPFHTLMNDVRLYRDIHVYTIDYFFLSFTVSDSIIDVQLKCQTSPLSKQQLYLTNGVRVALQRHSYAYVHYCMSIFFCHFSRGMSEVNTQR